MSRRAKQTFGQRLAVLRQQAGLSVSQLAEKAKIGRQSLYRLEEGGRQPSWNVLNGLAAALDVSLAAFDGCE